MFGELTPGLMSKFEACMYTLKNERAPDRKPHPNTLKTNFNIFQSIVNHAIEIDELIKPEKNPLFNYSIKGVSTVNEKLTMDEIQKLAELELTPDTPILHSRNYFLFPFYCAGIRAGDVIQLRWFNITPDSRLYYQMSKNHKVRDLKLVPQAKEILAHYYNPEAK